ncbi:Glucuronokinase 1 [Ancistrocladus abbreviatus]
MEESGGDRAQCLRQNWTPGPRKRCLLWPYYLFHPRQLLRFRQIGALREPRYYPHRFHDLVHFNSLDHLVNHLGSDGYYGGVCLLMATCKVFCNHCKDNSIELKGGNFTLSYDSNIPRQTGLSGSGAIECAALNCLLDFYEVRHLKIEVRPNLILNAEKELGIVAELQDWVAQIYGGLVFMVLHSKLEGAT